MTKEGLLDLPYSWEGAERTGCLAKLGPATQRTRFQESGEQDETKGSRGCVHRRGAMGLCPESLCGSHNERAPREIPLTDKVQTSQKKVIQTTGSCPSLTGPQREEDLPQGPLKSLPSSCHCACALSLPRAPRLCQNAPFLPRLHSVRTAQYFFKSSIRSFSLFLPSCLPPSSWALQVHLLNSSSPELGERQLCALSFQPHIYTWMPERQSGAV